MDSRYHKYLIYLTAPLLILGVLLIGNDASKKPLCRVVYDAGSSGTRLYIYEKYNASWRQHEGPKVGALADPVREIRGRTWTDADTVVNEVVRSLDLIKTQGPTDKKGRPQWMAFDWSEQCHIVSANVYATAGCFDSGFVVRRCACLP